MKATHVWLTVLTIALVLNAVMMRTPAEGDECGVGIRKEHLDATPGAFVDDETIEIGDNGLKIVDGAVSGDVIANGAVTESKVDSIFGTWTKKDTDENNLTEEIDYKATCDGFVHTFCGATTTYVWVSPTRSNVTSKVASSMRMAGTAGQYVTGMYGGCMVAIKKNEYIRVEWGPNTPVGSPATHFSFMPIGSAGGLEKQ